MQSLGSQLRRYREEAGLSQVEVSSATGITQGHISAIEVGRRVPSLDILRRLVELYRLDAASAGTLLGVVGAEASA